MSQLPSIPGLDRFLEGPVLLLVALGVLVVLLLLLRVFTQDPAMRRRAVLVSVLLFVFVALRVWLPSIPTVLRMEGGQMVEVLSPLGHSVAVASLVVGLLAALLLAALFIVDLFLVWHLKAEVPKILPTVAVLTLFFFGVILILYYRTDLDITGLFTTSALFTVVIGLALQDTLGNLFSGLALQSERSFRVGDWVRFGTSEGVVSDVSWRATKIRTRDNDLVVVPNTIMGKDVLINYSAPSPVHGVVSEVGCHYRHPPDRVIDALLEAAARTGGVLPRPEPLVRTVAFGDFAITYQVRYWIRDYAAEPEIRSDFMTRVWYVFGRRGIEIPFPIRNVMMRDVTGRDGAGPEDARTDRVRERLQETEVFSFLDEGELARLAGRVRGERYFAGETVVRQGEPGDSLYVIDEGKVEVLAQNGEREERLAELGPGAFFGEMSMMMDEPRTATVRTLGPARLLVIDRDAFRDTLQANPDVAARLSETLAQRRRELDDALATKEEVPPEVEERRILDRIRSLFGF